MVLEAIYVVRHGVSLTFLFIFSRIERLPCKPNEAWLHEWTWIGLSKTTEVASSDALTVTVLQTQYPSQTDV